MSVAAEVAAVAPVALEEGLVEPVEVDEVPAVVAAAEELALSGSARALQESMMTRW